MSHMLNSAEVAAQLNITIENVRWLRRTGKLPYVKLGHRTVRFHRSDVESLSLSGVEMPPPQKFAECQVHGCRRPLGSNNQTGVCSPCQIAKRKPGDMIRICQGGCGRKLQARVSGDVCYRCQASNRQLDRAVANEEFYRPKQRPQVVDFGRRRLVRASAEDVA